MGVTVTFLVCLTILRTLTTAADEKSHDIWVAKIDKPEVGSDWLTNISYKLEKINKHSKALNLNVSLLQDTDNDDIKCSVKLFQNWGGKYVKAPADIPEKSCCEIINNDIIFWKCVQERSNLPEKCPILKGVIRITAFNPGACAYAKSLPSNQPEECNIIFMGTLKSRPIWKYVFYMTIKKRMEIS